MTKLSLCACCDGPLEPAQQLRYLVETETLDNPEHLARIRMLPALNGRPVPVCKACQSRSAAVPKRKSRSSNLLGALGVLSVGLLVGVFTSRG